MEARTRFQRASVYHTSGQCTNRGPGMWDVALGYRVAKEQPSAQVTGLDISLNQSPPQAWLSQSKLKLYEWDMTDPNGPPKELEGKFDLVHIRLVLLVLDNDITPVINNIIKLLAPGGCLQWDEGDFVQTKVLHLELTADSGKTAEQLAPYMTKLVASMVEYSKKDWAVRLPQILEENDFVDVTKDSYTAEPALLKFTTDLTLMVWDEIIDEMPDSQAERRAMLSQLVQGTKVDAARGGVVSAPKIVIVASKKA